MKRLVVCGDSFNCGIGCLDLFTEPYGVLLAEKLGYELIMLARGGASNYAAHLQAEYAVKHLNADLIIIGTTSYDRVDWVSEVRDKGITDLTALNINYHQYPPYNGEYNGKRPPDFYFKNHPGYNPALLTEQVGGIDYYLDKKNKIGNTDYFKRFHTEPREKLQMLVDAYVQTTYEPIKQQYDIGVILKAYMKAQQKGIRTIVLTDSSELIELINKDDILTMSWFQLSTIYPDTIGSGHAGPGAHVEVAEKLFKKFNRE